jgi:hypothetical protein
MKMGIIACVDTCIDNGEYLSLVIQNNVYLFLLQKWIVENHPGHVTLNDLHITLGVSPNRNHTNPVPSFHGMIELCREIKVVTREDKSSSYIEVTDACKNDLLKYITDIENTCFDGERCVFDPARVFHISLTNLTGEPRGSIARVWEHTPTVYTL